MFIEDQVDVRSDNVATGDPVGRRAARVEFDREVVVELGIWLSGIESFLASGHHSFADARDKALPDSTREFRLVHTTLQRCAMLNGRLLGAAVSHAANETMVAGNIKLADLASLQTVVREVLLLSDGLIRSNSLGSGEWKAWSRMLTSRFRSLPGFIKLIRYAEVTGEKCLPGRLLQLTESREFLSAEHAELALVLPRFGKVLKWLSVVGRMLEADEPLKSSLLIFARVNEQIVDLTSYINNRLERFPNEEDEIFGTLDAASYTASIELKKVYSQELSGLAKMRPSPSIFARIETAYSLLTESFQQTLAGFVRLIEPETDIFELFPSFNKKRQQSVALRGELWTVVNIVQDAEKTPEKSNIELLHRSLRGFMKGSVKYLFYKDIETVERFVEEILVTRQNKDLVPILHRFGAYLETLFGQVNLRAVLVKHPFEPKN